MNVAEKIKLGQLIGRQKLLYLRIKEADKKTFEEMTATEQRRYDQDYGECVGIEMALGLFGIAFKSVDDR